MRFPALLALLGSVCALSGCSQPRPQSPAPPVEPTAIGTTAPTKPASPSTMPTHVDAAASTDQPAKPSAGDRELADYSRKLWVILGARDLAEREWRETVKKKATEIDRKGMAALVPPYRQYARAVDRAAKAALNLKPPATAKSFHATLLSNLDRLNENLSMTVEAMDSDDGEAAANLSNERQTITKEGAEALKRELERGGFDITTFLNEGKLVRKD